jgi:OOP family OmpA-OmpF porin
MKKAFTCALAVALLGMSTIALADTPGRADDNDLSWWGKSGATPAPYKDETRSGYWWWPTEPASNADDGELWGNRGIVYHIYSPDVTPPQPPPPPPPPQPPAVVSHVPVLSHVLFDFDKATLKPEGKVVLDDLIAKLKQWPKDTVLIEGHTCDIGTDEYNMGLGQRRADAVKKYLLDNGIDAARLSTKSFGETTPAVPNDSAANRKLNRRAEFEWTQVN